MTELEMCIVKEEPREEEEKDTFGEDFSFEEKCLSVSIKEELQAVSIPITAVTRNEDRHKTKAVDHQVAEPENFLIVHPANNSKGSGFRTSRMKLAAEESTDPALNPWPHVEPFFLFTKAHTSKRTVTYQCLACQPKVVTINAHSSSLFNLKSHMRRLHVTLRDEFEDIVSMGSRRGRHCRKRLTSLDSATESSPVGKKHRNAKKNEASQAIDDDSRQAVEDNSCHFDEYDSVHGNLGDGDCQAAPKNRIGLNQDALGRRKPSSEAVWNEKISSDQAVVGYSVFSSAAASDNSTAPDQAATVGRVDVGQVAATTAFEAKMVDFFVENWIPLPVVESETFTSFVAAGSPAMSPVSQLTLARRIQARYEALQRRIISLTESLSWVSATLNCWKCKNKLYLCLTLHWLDPQTRARQQALLALVRLTGSSLQPTYEVVAKTVNDHLHWFRLKDKVRQLTVDCGTNFAGKFRHFGLDQAESDPVILELDHGDNEQACELAELLQEEVSNGDQLPKPVGLDQLLLRATASEMAKHGHLPRHMKCALHTLNLVATSDAAKAMEDAAFAAAFGQVLDKAQGLWCAAQGHRSAEIIAAELKQKLVVPNVRSAHWIAIFDAMAFLNRLLAVHRDGVVRVMTRLELSPFTLDDTDFIVEYTAVMSPMAEAQASLLAESQAHLGCLLPTLALVTRSLRQLTSSELQFCQPLATALLAGLEARFGCHYIQAYRECQLAAGFHPRYRLGWLEKANCSAQLEQVRLAMVAALQEEQNGRREKDTLVDAGMTACVDGETRASQLIDSWSQVGGGDAAAPVDLSDDAFLGEPALARLFVKYNTALPIGSVSLQFKWCQEIVKASRANISDRLFEMIMFLKGNKYLH